MLFRLARAALAASLIFAAVLALAGSASAAAQVDRFNLCFPATLPSGTPVTVCEESRLVANTTVTPSGNVSFVLSQRRNTTITGVGCNYSEAQTIRQHFLSKDGFTLTARFLQLEDESNACPSAPSFPAQLGEHCQLVIRSHVVFRDGEPHIQYAEFNVVCTDSPSA